MKKYFALSLLILFISKFNCSFTQDLKARDIISKSIESYGGKKFSVSKIGFSFREKQYSIELNDGLFEYKRISKDGDDETIDILNNEGFKRLVNNDESMIASLMSDKYSSSINSVVYFALLPYRLSDQAVISSYLGKIQLFGKEYHKVKVRFTEESGGEDHEDEFIYWFDSKTYSMDYLAYSYQTNGGGIRFRKAFNKRTVNGLVFQDYENYKADSDKHLLENLDDEFEKGNLELLSIIELKKISVK